MQNNVNTEWILAVAALALTAPGADHDSAPLVGSRDSRHLIFLTIVNVNICPTLVLNHYCAVTARPIKERMHHSYSLQRVRYRVGAFIDDVNISATSVQPVEETIRAFPHPNCTHHAMAKLQQLVS